MPQAFSIADVSAPAPGAYSAHIVWTTTEPAAATLQWGPTELQPLLWTDAPHSTTTHDLTLDALAANTSYTVTITALQPDVIAVRNLEAIDGTPVLDIKPVC